ncbi:hypothetical protein ASG22_10500 [Chryseobacterium sp. Leaf405]|uniref:hypothetical protein n=1 Tax=Chryseobacterium sp. Leaf405 TaxID=1736367 RepID=UPI0006F829EE|nr:hypothetical protein [Chryseobacterium sp. Leaf405]KQT24428.1 hypothetical protein ASG22_10500 [Chryseobacterium sp. Leaf405]
MWVNCKIISENTLIHYKLKEFIDKTHFLTLSEEKTPKEDDHIIFWDNDSMNIDTPYLKGCMDKGSIVIVISSIFPKNIISNFFEEDQRLKIGVLTKNMYYNQFLEEISRVIDNLNS